MVVLCWVFLGMVVWGVIYLMYYFMFYMVEIGIGLLGLIDVWYVNDLIYGLIWDLIIVVLVLVLWVIVELIQKWDWLCLIVILVMFCIGVSCGLFFYLFLWLCQGLGFLVNLL